MLRQSKTFNNVKLVVVLTFIVSRGTNLILEEHDIQFSACLYQMMNQLISIDQALWEALQSMNPVSSGLV